MMILVSIRRFIEQLMRLYLLRGNGLVFLPVSVKLRIVLTIYVKLILNIITLLPLYSRQNNEEQARIFSNDGGLKIIL